MQNIISELKEAIAVCQCAEDAATESHIKTTLGVVNGTLLAVIAELEARHEHEGM